MRTLKITSDCLVKGEHTPAGTELQIDPLTAQQLLDAGVATEIKHGKTLGPGVETRDPEPEHRDSEPKKTKTGKGKDEPSAPDAGVATEAAE